MKNMSCTRSSAASDEFVVASDESVAAIGEWRFHATQSRVPLDVFVPATDKGVSGFLCVRHSMRSSYAAQTQGETDRRS